LNRTLNQIREAGAKAGVALNPSTPPQDIEWVLGDLDLILVMSVNPGFGGQAFIPSSYAKVRQIKSLLGKRPVDISVDGGVNRDKASRLAQAGATILVAGSAIFGAQDHGQAVKDLRSASEVLK
jgi:ribulose-phosphate 3-epimerase